MCEEMRVTKLLALLHFGIELNFFKMRFMICKERNKNDLSFV